ncbi:MAG: ribosome silencing factor [Proteobacteria bacterium]|nr:ribosome silencing factor [Pseudomonadota bacterium]NBX85823.1 ribosome silencing factor [Pseudomonadota bacterium]
MSLETKLKAALATLEDYKAQQISVIPLAGKATFADYMIVVSGTSTTHTRSIAQGLEKHLKSEVFSIEGQQESSWICVDLSQIIVHIFLPEKRALYNLEKLWSHTFIL